ncbi:MAG: tyrosine-type recombinase/integrase [Firmicutes bacterium]|nr:tyrosine-type recombinase/integrase [Bacillota bacterium]
MTIAEQNKNELYEVFLKKYPKNSRICEMWMEATNTDFTFANMNKPNFAVFVDYLQSHVARSSARTYVAMVKSVLNLYSENLDLQKGWDRVLSVKADESQQVYLNEEEIKGIIDDIPSNEIESIVQRQFLLGCLTGARDSDYSQFTTANLQNGKLVYVSQKTHVKAELPLCNVAKAILQPEIENTYKYGFQKSPFYDTDITKEVSDPTFNEYIRLICKKVGICKKVRLYRRGRFEEIRKYEAVSSHTSRRSFCTNLYLRTRDIMLVSKLAGHKSATQTETYIVCGMESMTDNAMAYFDNFK